MTDSPTAGFEDDCSLSEDLGLPTELSVSLTEGSEDDCSFCEDLCLPTELPVSQMAGFEDDCSFGEDLCLPTELPVSLTAKKCYASNNAGELHLRLVGMTPVKIEAGESPLASAVPTEVTFLGLSATMKHIVHIE